jgi:hypothetical protein
VAVEGADPHVHLRHGAHGGVLRPAQRQALGGAMEAREKETKCTREMGGRGFGGIFGSGWFQIYREYFLSYDRSALSTKHVPNGIERSISPNSLNQAPPKKIDSVRRCSLLSITMKFAEQPCIPTAAKIPISGQGPFRHSGSVGPSDMADGARN